MQKVNNPEAPGARSTWTIYDRHVFSNATVNNKISYTMKDIEEVTAFDETSI